MKKVAILGATGHIGKALAHSCIHNENDFILYLISRSLGKINDLKETFNGQGKKNSLQYLLLNDFAEEEYDVVINATGISDMSLLQENPANILTITRAMDSIVIEYLKAHPKTLYINMSSGAVYTAPNAIEENMTVGAWYAFAKKESEERHRQEKDLSIVDVRIFSFFSRFIDTKSHFLMSDIVNALLSKKPLVTSNEDIIRDYISPNDLLTLIKMIINKGEMNDFFDAYSSAPVAKFELLAFLRETYGLIYEIQDSASNSLSHSSYYAQDKKAKTLGYVPSVSSLTCIDQEVKAILF